MRLRLGTDRQQAATGSAEWYLTQTTGLPRLLGRIQARLAPKLRKVGPDGVRGDFPSGMGHAVPTSSMVALCGVAPPYLWNGELIERARPVIAGMSGRSVLTVLGGKGRPAV